MTDRPDRVWWWAAGAFVAFIVLVITLGLVVPVVRSVLDSAVAPPFHDCGPAMVAELKQEAIFEVAGDGRAPVTPDVECRDRDAGMAAEAAVDFRTDDPPETIVARFGQVAARSGWTVRPVGGTGPSPRGIQACARKDVRGQAWQAYVDFDGDATGHYWVITDVDSDNAIC